MEDRWSGDDLVVVNRCERKRERESDRMRVGGSECVLVKTKRNKVRVRESYR